ncbi:MAG: hypothetical protein LRY27_00515 [Chitinophagales bacterium]|nr:hypothetical protein [Chitinophagales bacterium]
MNTVRYYIQHTKTKSFDGAVSENFKDFVLNNTEIPADMLEPFGNSSEDNLHIGGMHYADAVTIGSEDIDSSVIDKFNKLDVPKLPFITDKDILIEYAKFVKEVSLS